MKEQIENNGIQVNQVKEGSSKGMYCMIYKGLPIYFSTVEIGYNYFKSKNIIS